MIENLCNDDGDLIIDGQKAYHTLLEQYGGPDTRELLVDRAREKIHRVRLEPTGDLGTHLAVLRHAFIILKRYGDGYTK